MENNFSYFKVGYPKIHGEKKFYPVLGIQKIVETKDPHEKIEFEVHETVEYFETREEAEAFVNEKNK